MRIKCKVAVKTNIITYFVQKLMRLLPTILI